MTVRLFKRSEDGAILCGDCLPPRDVLTTAELSPNLFPGTFHLLKCSHCGVSAQAPVAVEPDTGGVFPFPEAVPST